MEENLEYKKLFNDIEQGIKQEEFTLFYQPQFNLVTNKIVGVETLVRWMHPERGMLSPAVFIPFAEETRQIYSLENWIFKKALQQKEQWEKVGLTHLELAINMSSKTLGSEVEFNKMEELLAQHKVNYTSIVIEITETALLVNTPQIAERIQRLKGFGVKIALDDFGTGYSSLSHLKTLPIDIIKIDRSFVSLVPEEEKDAIIIKNILSMAHDMKYRVVAEGIEDIKQVEYLKKMSCEIGQGFLLAVPLPLEKLNRLLC